MNSQNRKKGLKNKITSIVLIVFILISTLIPISVLALTKEERLENINKIGGYLVEECGLNVHVVFGILGNIEQESGFNPASVNHASGASGICQWLGGRKTKMINHCGSDWKTDLDGQLEYLKKELNSDYKSSVLDKLKKLPDNEKGMRSAVEIWCRHFEICGNYEVEYSVRYRRAKKLYDELDGKLAGYAANTGIEDYSIKQELFSGTSSINLTDGSILSTTVTEKEDRAKLNSHILKTTGVKEDGTGTSTGPQYNYYQRFGPKLQFVEYLGEVTTTIELADHIVSAATEDKIKDIKLTDDVINYKSNSYLSTVVYKDRPPALDEDMLKNGYIDPRVTLYKSTEIGKLYTLVHARIILSFSTFIVGTVNLFIDNHFFVFILDTFKKIVQSDVWKMVDVGVNFILGIFILFYVISLIKHAIGYARGKSGETIMVFMTRWFIGILSIGLVSVFIANPTSMLDKSEKVINFVDDVISANIATVYKGDPAIYSESGKYTMQAAVWTTSLYDPWCKALFGRPHDECYTQFATVGPDGSPISDDQKLPQSYNPDHEHPKVEDGEEIFYDSAGCTGDVFVDLGGGYLDRNWATYALSTMSVYHIGHEIYEDEIDTSKFKTFPVAKTTYRNKNLYADTFRWIDAKMNISPQYFIDDEEQAYFNNYGDSRDFTTHYYKYSWLMLWNSILLALIIPVIVLRLKAFLGIVYVAVKGIYYSLVELVKENQGLSVFWSDMKENVVKYIYHSIQLYILLFLYTSLIPKGFLLQCIFILLCIVISGTNLRDLKFRAESVVKGIKHFISV